MLQNMISKFPNFKKIKLSDKEEVEEITKKYPPYSDFNFMSMWSWDTEKKMRLSILNGNLVVRFTDYITGEPFYSFLGDNKIDDTVEKLLEFSKKEGLKAELKLVPEHSIKDLDANKYTIKKDQDNFDYILSVKILKDFDSMNSVIQRKKRAVNSLIKEHSPYVKVLNLTEEINQKLILGFIKESMAENKVAKNELLAISRFIKGYKNINFVIMGAFVDDKLVGFSFTEVLEGGFANFHFWKADIRKYKPMYSYILKENCSLLSSVYDSKFLNIEQDLGIENLRQWKSGFDSQLFLEKYIVSCI